MKKIIYLITVLVALSVTSCENYLDTQDLTHKTTANFPVTYADAQATIVGIYNMLNNSSFPFNFFQVSELASDDRFGGGGANDQPMQAIDLLMTSGINVFNGFWKDRYSGIHRANYAIETFDKCEFPNDNTKNQMLGEAYFLRAFYYYELASLFENIPLVLASDPANNPQATPDETWGQIISDLKQAITLMPATKFTADVTRQGHADKWAAEALMARAFLFYTGFYQKDAVTLPDGSTVSKSDVTGWIDDCVNNSGYSLVPDFRNLWAYTNRCTVEDYSYTKGQNLKWVENDNGVNPESMFAIKFSKFASWNSGGSTGFASPYALFSGVRSQPAPKVKGSAPNGFPFGPGWGIGTATPNLWDDWAAANPNDMRRQASICRIPDELPNYKIGCGGGDSYIQETDYRDKKLCAISSKKADGTGYWDNFEVDMYDFANNVNMQLNNIHDLVLIRFADVLLMQSELKQDVSGINKVRDRAGLAPLGSYSLAALQNERRWELAFEGVRWNDIRRWHIAETALARQNNQPIYTNGVAATNSISNNGGGYVARYQAMRGFFQIPESQIALSNGVLVQNAGWGPDALYTGWR